MCMYLLQNIKHSQYTIRPGVRLRFVRFLINNRQCFTISFCPPGKQSRPVYLPPGDKDGGRGVPGMVQLDVELGRRGGGETKGSEDWRYAQENIHYIWILKCIQCM